MVVVVVDVVVVVVQAVVLLVLMVVVKFVVSRLPEKGRILHFAVGRKSQGAFYQRPRKGPQTRN